VLLVGQVHLGRIGAETVDFANALAMLSFTFGIIDRRWRFPIASQLL
jgi:hypothetical protein